MRVGASGRKRSPPDATVPFPVLRFLCARCVRLFETDPHPNLIRFYSFIISPSYALCVMESHPRLMPVSLSEAQARPYMFELVSAVAHLHRLGITHSDIKPSNILLSKEDRPILIDFGFAQHYDVEHPAAFLSSLSWGTPGAFFGPRPSPNKPYRYVEKKLIDFRAPTQSISAQSVQKARSMTRGSAMSLLSVCALTHPILQLALDAVAFRILILQPYIQVTFYEIVVGRTVSCPPC